MNEAITIARQEIEQAEQYLGWAREYEYDDKPEDAQCEVRNAVGMVAHAMKEVLGAVEALERRVNDLEYREHRGHGR